MSEGSSSWNAFFTSITLEQSVSGSTLSKKIHKIESVGNVTSMALISAIHSLASQNVV